MTRADLPVYFCAILNFKLKNIESRRTKTTPTRQIPQSVPTKPDKMKLTIDLSLNKFPSSSFALQKREERKQVTIYKSIS